MLCDQSKLVASLRPPPSLLMAFHSRFLSQLMELPTCFQTLLDSSQSTA